MRVRRKGRERGLARTVGELVPCGCWGGCVVEGGRLIAGGAAARHGSIPRLQARRLLQVCLLECSGVRWIEGEKEMEGYGPGGGLDSRVLWQ